MFPIEQWRLIAPLFVHRLVTRRLIWVIFLHIYTGTAIGVAQIKIKEKRWVQSAPLLSQVSY